MASGNIINSKKSFAEPPKKIIIKATLSVSGASLKMGDERKDVFFNPRPRCFGLWPGMASDFYQENSCSKEKEFGYG